MLIDAETVRKIHDKLASPSRANSFSGRCRGRRWNEFARRFPDLDSMRVLDLGGTPAYWRAAAVRPAHVTTVNLDPFDAGEPWIDHIVGDACDTAFDGYDLVVSNSLVEHVGGYQRRCDLARVIQAAAPRWWVQTPARSFPVEPHYVCPFLQFFPLRWRAGIVRRWPINHVPVDTATDALEQVLNIELVTKAELWHLFPDSEIWHERWLGMSKSLVAIKA